MRAGRMRQRVKLLAQVPTTDPRWGGGTSPQQVATIWAEVLPLTGTAAGTEEFQNQGVQTADCFMITTRYREDIDSQNQLAWDGHTLEILNVADPDGCRATLEIVARLYPVAAGGAS